MWSNVNEIDNHYFIYRRSMSYIINCIYHVRTVNDRHTKYVDELFFHEKKNADLRLYRIAW